MAKNKRHRSGRQTVRGTKKHKTRPSHYKPRNLGGQDLSRPSRSGEETVPVKRAYLTGNSSASQRNRILHHLQNTGPLTTLECRHKLDCMHPGMRICELRKSGYLIVTVWVSDVTPEGYVHQVGKYILVGKKQLSLFDRQAPAEVQG